MLDETFAEALIHRSRGYRVLGFKLRPLSFWHEALLDCYHSPFVYWNPELARFLEHGLFDGKFSEFNFAELYIAASVCSCKFPERPALQAKRGRTFFYARRFARHLRTFSDFLADYRSVPEQIVSSDAGAIKTPWYLYNVEALRLAYPQLTEAQAWDSEVSYSKWKLTARAEASGVKIDIITPADRKQLAELGLEH